MYFGFAFLITEHVRDRINLLVKISDYLWFNLKGKSYGQGVQEAYFGISCSGPLSDTWKDIDTGEISQMKYTKTKKRLELTVNLGFHEVMKANDVELVGIVKKGISRSKDKVKSLKIDDFDINAFYCDLDCLLGDIEWMKHPEKYQKPHFLYQPEESEEQVNEEMDALKMNQDYFWRLINKSIIESKCDLENQINVLIRELSLKSEDDMIGFELTLRDLLRLSYDYNVMGLLKIINSYISDDTLLYFRCRLILYGKEIFQTVLRKPNSLNCRLEYDARSEFLLTVSDQAFINKYGGNTGKDLPRDFAKDYIDYDIDNYSIMGKPWEENGFSKRFAKLIKLYGC